MGVRCLDAGVPAGLRELSIQARAVDMDSRLAAEVAQRGRVLDRCGVIDRDCADEGRAVPPVQVVHIGEGPAYMEFCERRRARHWVCTCGTCAKCLGPETFGGVRDDEL